jgi:hypothetical protein
MLSRSCSASRGFVIRFLGAAFVALSALAALAAPAFAQSTVGWTFTMKMDVDSGGSGGNMAMTMRQQRTPTKVRTDFSSSMIAGSKIDGMYSVMSDADSTIMSVVPGMRMATIMSSGSLMTTPIAQVKSGAEHLSVDSLEDLGESDAIAGRATHHYRETRVGTLDVAMGDQLCVQHFNAVNEVWLSSDPELLAMMAASKEWLAGSPFQAFGADMTSATSKMPKGFPLRSVHRSVTPRAHGAPETVTTSMEVLELEHGALADSLFAAPADYKIMDMRKMMADMPAGMMESTMKKSADQRLKIMCDAGGH